MLDNEKHTNFPELGRSKALAGPVLNAMEWIRHVRPAHATSTEDVRKRAILAPPSRDIPPATPGACNTVGNCLALQGCF